MSKNLRIIYILFLLLGLETHLAFAQTSFASEDDMKKQAQKLFSDEEFEQAFPLYSQLVSLYPKDPNYNYRLGVCMLFASDDKERPIPFLEFASHSKDVDKEAFYYLGKAYHLNYRFDEAIASYFAYKKVASNSNAQRLMVDHQIEMCKNGKQLLRNLTDLIVIDKKEMSREDFYRSYDISGLGGKLLSKPDEKEFKTPLDKKKKDNSIIYLASNNNQIYFASYGTDGKHGKDIFLVKKLPNGEWSQGQTLGSPINTEYDEDYPFLHPNGRVLYFCSKGHNSMGGYDIFKSTFNTETNNWNPPVNLDFPINTPDDDILYVTDGNEKEAYFSSARSSKTGSTAVYHINVERKPIDFAIIKGTVVKNRDNQKLDAKITVKDLADNSILGIYNSSPETGIYVINLPSSGRFLYTVESEGFATQSEMITLPMQHEFKPMKQEISYDPTTDKLIVKNSFDQEIDDSNYLLAMKYIKEKSKMDVSPVESVTTDASKEIDTVSAQLASNQNKNTTTTTGLTNDDIVKIAYNDAKDVETEAKDLREQADIALNFANQKNEQAQNKTKEASGFMEEAAKTDDNIKKQAITEKAADASKEAELLNQETVSAFNLAKKLDIAAKAKQEEADLSLKYSQDLEAAVKSKNATDALARLEAQEKKLEELSQKNSATSSISNSLKIDLDNKQRELDKAIQTSSDLKTEIADNETIITNLGDDLDNTKNEDLQKGLSNQIDELNKDIAEKQKQIDQNELVVAKLQKELAGINNENLLVNSVIDQSKTGTSETAAANVSSIDKNKLEEQVNNIKNSSSSTNSIATTTSNNQQPTANYDKYTTDLAAAEKLTDEIEREKTKSDVLKKWSEAIDSDVAKQKQNLVSATSEEKTSINQKIADAEKLSAEKQTQSDVSLAKVETLKQKQVIAANTTNNTTTNVTTTSNNQQQETNPAFTKYETNLADAEKITDATEREKAKADLYLMWSQALDADIAKQKQNLNATTDPEQKEIIAKRIEEEEKLSGEKQTQSDVSLAKLESLKQQKAIATNNQQPTTNEQPLVIPDYKKYEDNLADAEKISDESEREKTKADVFKKWSEAIEMDVAKQKQSLETTTDTEQKALLAKNISDAEQLYKEKQTQSDNSLAKVETLKQQNETVTTNVTPVTNNEQPITTPDYKVYSDNFAEAEKISDETEREKTKADVLKKWSEAIDADVAKQKQEFIATTDPEKKKLLSETISAGKELSEEKQLLANESLAKVESIKQPLVVHTNTVIPPDTSVTQNTTETNAGTTVKSVNATTNESRTPYSASGVADQIEKSNIINKEADDLIARSVELKSQAVEQTNEETKNSMYAQSEDLIKQSKDKKMEAAQLIASANKAQFFENQELLNKYVIMFQKNEADEISIAEMMSDESKIFFEKGQKFRTQADSSNLYYEKEAATDEAYKNELIALDKQRRGIDIYKKYDTTGAANLAVASTSNKNPDNVNTTEPTTNTTQPITNTTQPETNTTQPTNTIQPVTNTIQPSVISLEENEKFERKSVPVYSANKPIPVNEKLPEGLIFKVQIGAFKNPIPQDLFQGMSPITGETTPQGFIRYTAGLFIKFSTADKVKKEIRDLGYKDAFVVAFLNGKRISMNEALTMAGINPAEIAQANNNQTSTTTQTPVATTNNQQPIANNQQTAIAHTENIAAVNGLFYTVQIGVFSQQVSSEKLYNIQPLYIETAPNGNLRYNTGIYNNVQRAAEAKDIIVGKGLKDAYVTAYYQGKRISLTEAKQLEAQGSSVFSTVSTINEMPNFNTVANQTPAVNTHTEQPITNNQQPNSNENQQLNKIIDQNNTQTIESGVIYKVQIGAFSNEVPLQVANKFLSIASEGIKNYKDEKGLTIYTIGSFKTYDEAAASKVKVAGAGIPDAFIVAYNNGKKISLDEAKTLLNK